MAGPRAFKKPETGEEKRLLDLAKPGPGGVRIGMCVVLRTTGVEEGGKDWQQGRPECW